MNNFDRWQAVLISRDLARSFARLATNPIFLFVFMLCAVCSSLTNQHQQSPTAGFSAEDFANQAYKKMGGAAVPSNYPQILENYTQAINLNPSLAQAYAGRGTLYWQRIHYLKTFQITAVNQKVAKEFDLDPAQIPVLQQLALQDYQQAQTLYSQQGKRAEAKQVEKAIAQAQRGEKFFCVPVKENWPWMCVKRL